MKMEIWPLLEQIEKNNPKDGFLLKLGREIIDNERQPASLKAQVIKILKGLGYENYTRLLCYINCGYFTMNFSPEYLKELKGPNCK